MRASHRPSHRRASLRSHPIGVSLNFGLPKRERRCTRRRNVSHVSLMDVSLMGVAPMGMALMGVSLMGVPLMGVALRRVSHGCVS
jgi:hypothetical protein